MIGSMLAGETLHELRASLQLAELERLGGIGAQFNYSLYFPPFNLFNPK